MKIAESSVVMASASAATSHREVRESLRVWVGATRPDFEGEGNATTADADVLVSISDAGKAAQSAEANAIESASDAVENDPRMRLLKLIIEFMTGKRITLISAEDLQDSAASGASTPTVTASAQPSESAGFGVEYDYHESYSESATMSFAASGTIRTADGKDIAFSLSLSMQHHYSEETNISIREGDAKKVDPLIINFSGNAAQLTSQKFSFDLDADGARENISFVQGGGFLTLDRNNDGKVNDGKELFGPATGNGFSELAALDDDGNNWIDENDAAYAKLRIWTRDADGKDILATLKQSHVGALFLGNATSPFDIKDAQNVLAGQVRASGVWLSEDGKAGSMQQIDLVA